MITVDAGLDAYLEAHHDERLESYLELLRIPSISGLSEHAPDMLRAARWIVAELARIGLDNAEICETPGHPVVYADWLHAPGALPRSITSCPGLIRPRDSSISLSLYAARAR